MSRGAPKRRSRDGPSSARPGVTSAIAGAEEPRGWAGLWTIPDTVGRDLDPQERLELAALLSSGVGPARLARTLTEQDLHETFASRGRLDLASVRARLEAVNARFVVPGDDEYPEVLRRIDSPPLGMWVRGERLNSLLPAVAVVGSRICTPGARRFARRLGASFADAGLSVVSGLARGVDAGAHEGALDAGRTIAVLGTGVDRVYPAEHARLAERIAERGALVSEFAPGTGPRPWHFPARNRIVSALALATVVVEAGERSGALITASFALDQGRDVFACTVAPENPAGAGVRQLLRDGASLVVDADDATQELLELARAQGWDLAKRGRERPQTGQPLPTGDRGVVLEAVLQETSVDEVCAVARIEPGRAAAALASLELDGYVVEDGNGRWSRRG